MSKQKLIERMEKAVVGVDVSSVKDYYGIGAFDKLEFERIGEARDENGVDEYTLIRCRYGFDERMTGGKFVVGLCVRADYPDIMVFSLRAFVDGMDKILGVGEGIEDKLGAALLGSYEGGKSGVVKLIYQWPISDGERIEDMGVKILKTLAMEFLNRLEYLDAKIWHAMNG